MKNDPKSKRKFSSADRRALLAQIESLVSNANSLVVQERRVSIASAVEVANRDLRKTRGASSESRIFSAVRAVSAHLSLALNNRQTTASLQNADLLPVGHPASKRKHAMTASALRYERARWLAADKNIKDDVRALIIAAHSATPFSVERAHAFARLGIVASGLSMPLAIDPIIAVAGFGLGGNSRAARSLRAQLQRRDRYGRFAFMGGGFNFSLRLPNGLMKSISGRVVGASGDDDVEIEVVGSPDLPDGIYAFPAGKGQSVKAVLDRPGISRNVTDSTYVEMDEIRKLESPTGWEKIDDFVWQSEDGYFVSMEESTGEMALHRADLRDNGVGEVVATGDGWADMQEAARDDSPKYEKVLQDAADREQAGRDNIFYDEYRDAYVDADGYDLSDDEVRQMGGFDPSDKPDWVPNYRLPLAEGEEPIGENETLSDAERARMSDLADASDRLTGKVDELSDGMFSERGYTDRLLGIQESTKELRSNLNNAWNNAAGANDALKKVKADLDSLAADPRKNEEGELLYPISDEIDNLKKMVDDELASIQANHTGGQPDGAAAPSVKAPRRRVEFDIDIPAGSNLQKELDDIVRDTGAEVTSTWDGPNGPTASFEIDDDKFDNLVEYMGYGDDIEFWRDEMSEPVGGDQSAPDIGDDFPLSDRFGEDLGLVVSGLNFTDKEKYGDAADEIDKAARALDDPVTAIPADEYLGAVENLESALQRALDEYDPADDAFDDGYSPNQERIKGVLDQVREWKFADVPPAEDTSSEPSGMEQWSDEEFVNEIFPNVPDGATKIDPFMPYEPKGRTSAELSPDYTDDPEQLATKFNGPELVRALNEAVSPDGGGNGFGDLPFEDGDDSVPAHAIFEAINNQGLDGEIILAKIYDMGLPPGSGTPNEDRVNEVRDGVVNLQQREPDVEDVVQPRFDWRSDATVANSVSAESDRAARAVSLINDHEETNSRLVEVGDYLREAAGDFDLDEDIDRSEYAPVSKTLKKFFPFAFSQDDDERDAFRGLWGAMMSIDGGDSSPEDMGREGSIRTLIYNELLSRNNGNFAMADIEYSDLWDEYGDFSDFARSRMRIAEGLDGLDAGTSAAAMYRLVKATSRPNDRSLYRAISVDPDNYELLDSYTTVGGRITMDPRSFTDMNIADGSFASQLFFSSADQQRIVFVAPEGSIDSADMSAVSWFSGEQESLAYGTFDIESVRVQPLQGRPGASEYVITIRRSDVVDASNEISPAYGTVASKSDPVSRGVEFYDGLEDWEMVGGQQGSNVGGTFRDADGREYYVKTPKSRSHAENEALAAKLYKEAGIPVADMGFGYEDAQIRLVSPIVPGEQGALERAFNEGDQEFIDKVRDGFAVDAWLGNWDALGLGLDNIVADEDGNPVRIDQGAALFYRARGSSKRGAFGDRVWEVDTLTDPDLFEEADGIYSTMTDDDIRRSLRHLEDMTPDRVDAIVDSVISDPTDATILKNTLKARREYLFERYGVNVEAAAGDGGDDDGGDIEAPASPPGDGPDKVVLARRKIKSLNDDIAGALGDEISRSFEAGDDETAAARLADVRRRLDEINELRPDKSDTKAMQEFRYATDRITTFISTWDKHLDDGSAAQRKIEDLEKKNADTVDRLPNLVDDVLSSDPEKLDDVESLDPEALFSATAVVRFNDGESDVQGIVIDIDMGSRDDDGMLYEEAYDTVRVLVTHRNGQQVDPNTEPEYLEVFNDENGFSIGERSHTDAGWEAFVTDDAFLSDINPLDIANNEREISRIKNSESMRKRASDERRNRSAQIAAQNEKIDAIKAEADTKLAEELSDPEMTVDSLSKALKDSAVVVVDTPNGKRANRPTGHSSPVASSVYSAKKALERDKRYSTLVGKWVDSDTVGVADTGADASGISIQYLKTDLGNPSTRSRQIGRYSDEIAYAEAAADVLGIELQDMSMDKAGEFLAGLGDRPESVAKILSAVRSFNSTKIEELRGYEDAVGAGPLKNRFLQNFEERQAIDELREARAPSVRESMKVFEDNKDAILEDFENRNDDAAREKLAEVQRAYDAAMATAPDQRNMALYDSHMRALRPQGEFIREWTRLLDDGSTNQAEVDRLTAERESLYAQAPGEVDAALANDPQMIDPNNLGEDDYWGDFIEEDYEPGDVMEYDEDGSRVRAVVLSSEYVAEEDVDEDRERASQIEVLITHRDGEPLEKPEFDVLWDTDGSGVSVGQNGPLLEDSNPVVYKTDIKSARDGFANNGKIRMAYNAERYRRQDVENRRVQREREARRAENEAKILEQRRNIVKRESAKRLVNGKYYLNSAETNEDSKLLADVADSAKNTSMYRGESRWLHGDMIMLKDYGPPDYYVARESMINDPKWLLGARDRYKKQIDAALRMAQTGELDLVDMDIDEAGNLLAKLDSEQQSPARILSAVVSLNRGRIMDIDTRLVDNGTIDKLPWPERFDVQMNALRAADLKSGDVLTDDGGFVVERVFRDNLTPNGKISLEGYYPGRSSQRREVSEDDLILASKNSPIQPSGDLPPLEEPTKPKPAPRIEDYVRKYGIDRGEMWYNNAMSFYTAEYEQYLDDLAKFHTDRIVGQAWNCGGGGIQAAIDGGDSSCPTKGVDDLVNDVKSAFAAPDPSTRVDTPDPYAGEPFPPTEQQREVVDAVLTGDDVVVRALAGTGKTSTLQLIARRLKRDKPRQRIVYVAFNKSIQLEAQSKMPDNVESRTGDSIAYRAMPKEITAKMKSDGRPTKLRDIADLFGVQSAVNPDNPEEKLSNQKVTSIIRKAVESYAISADDEIGPQHFPFDNVPDEWIDTANAMWEDINDPNGRLRVSNSHITKMWALTRPDLSKSGSGLSRPADIVFFDEAQDINPVMGKVIADQGIQKVYVGDENQAIYGFRGAEDQLQGVDAPHDLPLTKSWRFGPQVAGMGNRFLTLLGAKHRVEGGGPEGKILARGEMENPEAILVRSNAGGIRAIAGQLDAGRTVGVSKAYKDDISRLIDSAAWLMDGADPASRPRVIHEDLAPYSSWDEVLEAVDDGEAPKVAMLTKLFNEYSTDELRSMIDRVKIATPGETSSKIDALPENAGASGARGTVGRDVNFEVNGNKITLSGKGTFDNKQLIKDAGFKWDPDSKKWSLTNTSEERRKGALTKLTNSMNDDGGENVDVVVTTAHKAKGLEWDNVQIYEDFWGPRVDKETGQKVLPSDEELRLAYVAVTRAKRQLDPGSLDWVYEETTADDEKPQVSMPDTGDRGELVSGQTGVPAEPDSTPADLVDVPNVDASGAGGGDTGSGPDVDTAEFEPEGGDPEPTVEVSEFKDALPQETGEREGPISESFAEDLRVAHDQLDEMLQEGFDVPDANWRPTAKRKLQEIVDSAHELHEKYRNDEITREEYINELDKLKSEVPSFSNFEQDVTAKTIAAQIDDIAKMVNQSAYDRPVGPGLPPPDPNNPNLGYSKNGVFLIPGMRVRDKWGYAGTVVEYDKNGKGEYVYIRLDVDHRDPNKVLKGAWGPRIARVTRANKMLTAIGPDDDNSAWIDTGKVPEGKKPRNLDVQVERLAEFGEDELAIKKAKPWEKGNILKKIKEGRASSAPSIQDEIRENMIQRRGEADVPEAPNDLEDIQDVIRENMEARRAEKLTKAQQKHVERTVGPRKVGGRYSSQYGGEYEVVAINIDDEGNASTTVRDDSGWLREHSTPWDPKTDSVISDPPANGDSGIISSGQYRIMEVQDSNGSVSESSSPSIEGKSS